jgi:hypothetical protein
MEGARRAGGLPAEGTCESTIDVPARFPTFGQTDGTLRRRPSRLPFRIEFEAPRWLFCPIIRA